MCVCVFGVCVYGVTEKQGGEGEQKDTYIR